MTKPHRSPLLMLTGLVIISFHTNSGENGKVFNVSAQAVTPSEGTLDIQRISKKESFAATKSNRETAALGYVSDLFIGNIILAKAQ